MGTRQQEKSLMTKTELKSTARQLFLEKGYDETSIQDIASLAGYSVGSVYRHWKSKQDLFMDIWDEYVSDFIRTSVKDAPENLNKEEMIDYLLERSECYKQNEMTQKLHTVSILVSTTYQYEGLLDWAGKYTQMLYLFLKGLTPQTPDHILKSAANIMHCLLNTDAMQDSNIRFPKYQFDKETLRMCLLALIDRIIE